MGDEFGRTWENLYRELDRMALTPFIPSVVLHKDLKNVPDFDDLPEEAGAEGS